MIMEEGLAGEPAADRRVHERGGGGGRVAIVTGDEGALAAAVPAAEAEHLVATMRARPEGAGAGVIGEVREGRPGVLMRTTFGSSRMVDMLIREQLPRIC